MECLQDVFCFVNILVETTDQWCDERHTWTTEWNDIVITGESCFRLQHHDARIRVSRHRELARGTPPAATPDQLWKYVEATWPDVPKEYNQNLFDSIPMRIMAVIANKGGCTNY
ncbi:hypothetical protein TNCV_3113231 [Trichonephila clavipes]|nr:hypothetical protein TNCV_3113231 [Trichonephila clavipes]